jgi:rubredoxin
MPFISAGDGDLKSAFITDVNLIDRFVGNRLWVTGSNTYGQLGDNTTVNQYTFIETITGGTNWQQVSTSLFHSAAIKTDGTLWCWGDNYFGQLGNNTITHRSSPVQTVAAGTNWKQVAGGEVHSAAIKTDGTLWCWGYNYYGQLGNNTRTHRSSPVQTVAAGTNWKQVSAGRNYTAAVKTDGTLWCWGENYQGQLGDGTDICKSSPIQTLAGGTNWKQVSCGGFHTAAIKTDGTLWLWGYNIRGQLGTNSTSYYFSPVQTISGGTNWKQVSCGATHTAAIKTDGTLWLWGTNSSGQLGDDTTTHKSSPVQTIAGGTDWKQVGCGASHTAAIKTDGTLWCWGNNSYGQLGDGTQTHKSSPIQTTAAGYNWKQVACGYFNIIAVTYGD